MSGWWVLFWIIALGPFALLIKGVRTKLFGKQTGRFDVVEKRR